MNCGNCGSEVDKGWKFCPKCGINIGSMENDLFSHIFKELQSMTKRVGFGANMEAEVIDISKMFDDVLKSMNSPARKGFSVRIRQRNNEQPKMMFRKFGGKKIFPNLRKPDEEKNNHKLGLKLPSETEEPETDISRSGNRVIVEIKLPGVKGAGDIDINELEGSVEVKAVAGNRGYFKIIRKPEFSRIARKSFENNALRIELL